MKAWRVWNISISRQVLVSALDPDRYKVPTYWQPGKNAAICKFNGHHAPQVDCRCGFRGQEDISELIWWIYDFKLNVEPSVLGAVELSGQIFTGDPAHPEIPRVIRAEFAEVSGPLYVRHVYMPAGPLLSRKYGVPVVPVQGSAGGWARNILK